ncbi:MAG: hypothetical protein AAF203_04680 [Pseudomonadota bacterium]
MNQSKELKDNLDFVSRVVKESENGRGVPGIYFLWALIVLIGFSITDFYPQFSGQFWMIAGPLGGIISGFLGWQYSRKLGQVSTDDLQKNLIHWGAMLAAIFMASSLVHNNLISGRGFGAVTLLIVAFSYILAGNYLDRVLLWLGFVMLAGFYPIVNNFEHTWTIIGVAVCAGLTIAGIKALKNEKA